MPDSIGVATVKPARAVMMAMENFILVFVVLKDGFEKS